MKLLKVIECKTISDNKQFRFQGHSKYDIVKDTWMWYNNIKDTAAVSVADNWRVVPVCP